MAKALRDAAALSPDPAFANFLRLRADALLSDDYYASDLAWLDLKDPKIDVIFAPYETYTDDLLGIKTSYGASILIRNEPESAKLAVYQKYVPEIQDALPLDAADRPSKRGHLTPMEVMDAPYPHRRPAPRLPGRRRQSAQRSAHPRKERLQENLLQELHGRARQLCHPPHRAEADAARAGRQGVRRRLPRRHAAARDLSRPRPRLLAQDGKQVDIREAIGPAYSGLEEAKADVVGMFGLKWLVDHKALPAARLEEYYASYVAGLFRTLRFGTGEAHGRAEMMEFNYLLENHARHPRERPLHHRLRPHAASTRSTRQGVADHRSHRRSRPRRSLVHEVRQNARDPDRRPRRHQGHPGRHRAHLLFQVGFLCVLASWRDTFRSSSKLNRMSVRACALLALIAAPLSARDWTVVRSPHFSVYSDASPETARALAATLERLHAFFARTIGLTPPPHRELRVIAFASPQEYAQYRTRPNADAFIGAQDRDYIVLPVPPRAELRIPAHEYAHVLIHSAGPKLPDWIAEGISEVVSTLQLRDRESLLGGDFPDALPSSNPPAGFPSPTSSPSASTASGKTPPARPLLRRKLGRRGSPHAFSRLQPRLSPPARERSLRTAGARRPRRAFHHPRRHRT